jgi:hypothetical protein
MNNKIITKNQYIKQQVDLGTTKYHDACLNELIAEFNYLLMNKIVGFDDTDIEIHTCHPRRVAGEFCVKLKDAGYIVSLTANRIYAGNRDSYTELLTIETGYDIRVTID